MNREVQYLKIIHFRFFLTDWPQKTPKRLKSILKGSLVVLGSNGSPKKFHPILGPGVIKCVHANVLQKKGLTLSFSIYTLYDTCSQK